MASVLAELVVVIPPVCAFLLGYGYLHDCLSIDLIAVRRRTSSIVACQPTYHFPRYMDGVYLSYRNSDTIVLQLLIISCFLAFIGKCASVKFEGYSP